MEGAAGERTTSLEAAHGCGQHPAKLLPTLVQALCSYKSVCNRVRAEMRAWGTHCCFLHSVLQERHYSFFVRVWETPKPTGDCKRDTLRILQRDTLRIYSPALRASGYFFEALDHIC